MKTLAAILVQTKKPLVLDEIEIPKLCAGQVLVKIYYSGICGTQLNEIDGKKGDNCIFKDVLIIADASKQTLGTPIIEGASVEATIVEQIRDKKITVFKKKTRKNYRRTKGHRQYLTV